jgi:hypothetical protein
MSFGDATQCADAPTFSATGARASSAHGAMLSGSLMMISSAAAALVVVVLPADAALTTNFHVCHRRTRATVAPAIITIVIGVSVASARRSRRAIATAGRH